jgi:soluble cytochrome b562
MKPPKISIAVATLITLQTVIWFAVCLLPVSAHSAQVDQVEKAAEKAAEKAVEKTTNKAAEKAVEKAAQKAIQEAAEQETEKAEIKATRPEDWKGPTKVGFRILVLDIDEIDGANQNFTVNVFMNLTWTDRRLASPKGAERQILLQQVWNPQVLIANQQGLLSRSLPEVVQVKPNGTVIYRQRYTGKLSQPLDLSEFPLDKHVFTIQFASAAYFADELEFVPDPSPVDPKVIGGAIASNLSLPDWQILRHEVFAAPYQPINEIRAAGFVFQFEAKRYIEYYIWQIVLPLTVVVVMSWAGFWVQRGQVGVRIGVATSSVLTLIAHRFVLASLLPRLPYMTRLDYFTVGSTLLVSVALLGVVFTSYLASINQDLLTRKVDLFARWTLPAAFLLLLLWFIRV